MPFYKTPAVADLLGVGYYRLIGLLRSRRLAPPQKDSSGDYIWTPEDVERARQVFATRSSNNEQEHEEPVLRSLGQVQVDVTGEGGSK